MTNPSVTSVLQNLEKKELICRETNPEDKRSKVIALTEKAYEMQEELGTVGARLGEACARNLSPDERATLICLLKKMLQKS